MRHGVLAFILLSFLAGTARAQSADNVLVVVNENSEASVEIGEYYAEARAIPEEQVARIKTTTVESLSYAEYVVTIEAPVARWIAERSLQDRILYVVLTKGVPIRILGTGGRRGTVASVDSELTLLYRKMLGKPTPVLGRVDNPYYLGETPVSEAKPFTRFDADIYLVTRLDGFTVDDAKGLVDRGLAPSDQGYFVLDQRANFLDSGGDRWLAEAATRLGPDGAGAPVILEESRALAKAPGPVLGYYSWGSNDESHRRRGSGLQFAPGALAGMFVSTDGRTFEEPPPDWIPGPSTKPPSMFGTGSQSVAADLVREGATGVSAHVGEPYLDGTARPQVLFPAYVWGMNLAEAFYLATPYLSWQNIILGDPLCAPFRSPPLTPLKIAEGIDPETELPALFAERRLAVVVEQARTQYDDISEDALKLVLRAGVRDSIDDTESAEAFLREAIELEPRLVGASLQLASYYEEREAYDLAVAEYRRMLDVDPENVVALNNLAFALAVREDSPAEALPYARRAYEIAPSPIIADTLGWVHHLLGNREPAARLLEQAAVAAPGNAELQEHAAFALAAAGQFAKARRALDLAVKADPDLAEREDIKELRERIGG